MYVNECVIYACECVCVCVRERERESGVSACGCVGEERDNVRKIHMISSL